MKDDEEFYVRVISGAYTGQYWLARGYGTTPDINKAFVYTEETLKSPGIWGCEKVPVNVEIIV